MPSAASPAVRHGQASKKSTCRECRLRHERAHTSKSGSDQHVQSLVAGAGLRSHGASRRAPGSETSHSIREHCSGHKTAHRTAVQPSHGRPRRAAGRGHRREGNARHVVEEAGRCRRTRQSSRDDPRGARVPHLWSTRGRCERRALQACTLATLPTGKPSSPLAAHRDACDAAQAAAREPAEGA